MLKTTCICDRCGKEVDLQQAQRIVFEPASSSEKKPASKLVELVTKAFKNPPQDFCPDCAAEIKSFMKPNGSRTGKGAAGNEPE